MIKKVKNIFFLIFLLSFIFFTISYYFSEENKVLINKSRSSYTTELKMNLNELPTLKNDTSNIIDYKNDIENFKKKRKKRFWEFLISNNNE